MAPYSANPTWLITGTSAGLGLALSQFVLAQGHNLVSISRHKNPPPALVEIIAASSYEHKPYFYHLSIDLSIEEEKSIKSALSDFIVQHEELQIDVIVNNAGVASFHALETFPYDTLRYTFTVNFLSPLWIIQSLLPHMRSKKWQDNGHGKVIMNVSSTQGLKADASELAYDASKHALESMSATLAVEIDPFNIRVIVVNLGSFRTAFANSGERNGLYTANRSISTSENNTAIADNDRADLKCIGEDDPYADPNHPVNIRMSRCLQLANNPSAARGDVHKASRILFSAVMRTSRSAVEQALEQQRSENVKSGAGKGWVERIVLGADGYPGIERQVARLKLELESCRQIVAMADCDDLL